MFGDTVIVIKCQKYFLPQKKKIELNEADSAKKELEEKQVNYIVDKENGSIKVYHNERMMLEALISLNQNDITLQPTRMTVILKRDRK